MKNRGFTLLELMVAVAILGLMLGAGALTFQKGKAQANVSGVARTLTGQLLRGRTLAVVASNAHFVFLGGSQAADFSFTRLPNVRSQLVLLRDIEGATYQPDTYVSAITAGDVPITQQLLPIGSRGVIDPLVAFRVLEGTTWRNLSGTPAQSFWVKYRPDSRAEAFIGPQSSPVALTLPVIVEMRDAYGDITAGDPTTNFTRRCVQLETDGSARVIANCP